MTKAEKLCNEGDLSDQTLTLAKAVLALQEKVETQIPIYEQMPLAQTVTVGTGERMLRQNPAVGEFRATVRDYAAALKSLQDILDGKEQEPEEEGIASLRKKFKLA